MNNPTTRFVACSTLLTVGLVLILLGLQWLRFLGYAMAFSASFFSAYRVGSRKTFAVVLLFLAFAVWSFQRNYQDGTICAHKPIDAWLIAVVIVAWIMELTFEGLKWRALRKANEVAEHSGGL